MAEAPARGVKSNAIREYLKQSPDASPKTVAAALKEKGLEVTEGLVSYIKYGQKPAAAKGATRKSGRPAKAAPAPTNGAGEPGAGTGERGSRSQAIRDYLKSNPKAGPSVVVKALAEQGIVVSSALVSMVKYGSKSKGAGMGSGRRGRPAAQPRPVVGTAVAASGRFSASDLLEAKRFVDSVGGLDQAQQALSVLEQLR